MPGKVRHGVNHTPIHAIDVLPTLAQVTGKPLPNRVLDGKSIFPLFSGGSLSARRLFWSQDGNSAVRDGNWKLVVPNGKPAELYNLATDIGETHDIASSNVSLVNALKSALQSWKNNTH